ncbi:hypothetical protein LXA43DRAFT_902765 [Ganoderma leucocontextum]|nr:hypothetical protein LXA43DRAFT_902765 [Ganoderma leucocontextum]
MNQESPNTFPFPDFASSMPAMDRASLEGLSKDEVRAWALRKSEEYRLLSYTMLSLHNAAAPIHTLPVELLMKIFSMTWFPENGRQGLHPTLVCRRWCTVYLSASTFWAEAVADLWFVGRPDGGSWTGTPWSQENRLSSEFVTMLLDRSSPHPIALHVEQTLRGARDLTLPTCPLPSTVFPHLNHVVSLYAFVRLLHLHDLYRVLDAGMPTLEYLDVGARESEPPDLAGTLASLHPVSDESLPRLYTLRLDPAIFFPLIVVRSLKSLHLDSSQDMSLNPMVPWPHPAGSDSRSLLRLLSRCRNLEYLHLEDFRPSRWWPPLGNGRSESGMVQLPSLKKLSFGDDTKMSALCAYAALAVLDPCIPSTASVHPGQLTDPNAPDSLSSLMPSYLVQHHPFDTVMLSDFRTGRWTIRCFAAQSLCLDIQFHSHKTLADLRIEDVFRTACVTQLEIIPGSNQDCSATATDPVEDWAAVLRAFPHLTHLTASGVDTPSGVVDALGAIAGHGVTADSDSDVLVSGSPLCPALRYLTLGWEVPREIGPKDLVRACDSALYRRHQDVGPRVEQRCSVMQPLFERRASMKAQKLHALEFYEYERQGYSCEQWDITMEFGELIASSRREDDDLPCLERLRTVVGGPVVYRGYLLKTVDQRLYSEI